MQAVCAAGEDAEAQLELKERVRQADTKVDVLRSVELMARQ